MAAATRDRSQNRLTPAKTGGRIPAYPFRGGVKMGSTPIERAFDRDQESDRPLGSPYAQERDDPQTRSDARDYGGGDGRADARLWYERTWSDESGGHFQDGPRLVGAASDSPIGQMFGNPKTRTIAVYDHDGGITTYTRDADAESLPLRGARGRPRMPAGAHSDAGAAPHRPGR